MEYDPKADVEESTDEDELDESDMSFDPDEEVGHPVKRGVSPMPTFENLAKEHMLSSSNLPEEPEAEESDGDRLHLARTVCFL